jgi:hypothetical protein
MLFFVWRLATLKVAHLVHQARSLETTEVPLLRLPSTTVVLPFDTCNPLWMLVTHIAVIVQMHGNHDLHHQNQIWQSNPEAKKRETS